MGVLDRSSGLSEREYVDVSTFLQRDTTDDSELEKSPVAADASESVTP